MSYDLTISVRVSIHAPWEGCDASFTSCRRLVVVSIHAPWEGCDHYYIPTGDLLRRFNSRTLGRVRLISEALRNTLTDVSIHAPWEGCDGKDAREGEFSSKFQFTHPGKGATGRT